MTFVPYIVLAVLALAAIGFAAWPAWRATEPKLARLMTMGAVGLFVLGSGITALQVAANPLSAALGDPARSHFRLVLSQAFNSLGTVIGPYLGARVMLQGAAHAGGPVDAAARTEALGHIHSAFLIIAALMTLLILFIWVTRRRVEAAAPPVVKKARLRSPGASAASRLASSTAVGWA